jgi:histidyl-tRNA synthetase
LDFSNVYGIDVSVLKIVIDPFLSSEDSTFVGVIFKIYCDISPGKSLCIAIAGQYDIQKAIDQHYKVITVSTSKLSGVTGFGISFALDAMAGVIWEQKRQLHGSKHQEIQKNVVYVASIGTDALRARMQIAGQLWKHGIHACFSDNESATLADQQNEATKQNIQYLLVLKDKVLHAAGTVKVRNLEKRTEIDLEHSKIVEYFINTGISRKKL